MERPTPAARYLRVGDRELLAGMRCSTGAWFEDDVQTFMRTRLGRAFQALGLIDQARGAFETVIELDPANVIATTRLRNLTRE